MKRLALLLLLAAAPLFAQSGGADPCLSSTVTKQHFAIAVGSATTTQLVAPITGFKVHVCGIFFTAATGTAATYTFEYGTGTTCGTGTTAVTGAMIGNNGQIAIGGGFDLFNIPTSNAFCLLTGGTGPSAQGFITYIQQYQL